MLNRSMTSESEQARVPHTARSEADNFIRALLYNQIPITAFFNRRTMLALFALMVGFLLITFIWPFFALIKGWKSLQVSLQLSAALLVFFISSLLASALMRCVGSKSLTFISLALATGGCFLLSTSSLKAGNDSTVDKQTSLVNALLLFTDTAIIGYLLISIAIAFLTIASLDEVLSGTANKLLMTKFSEASN